MLLDGRNVKVQTWESLGPPPIQALAFLSFRFGPLPSHRRATIGRRPGNFTRGSCAGREISRAPLLPTANASTHGFWGSTLPEHENHTSTSPKLNWNSKRGKRSLSQLVSRRDTLIS